MLSTRRSILFFILLLFCSSTHSFWGEQKIRSALSWLYSLRISQLILKKMGCSPKTPLEVIQTMIRKKENVTFINNLDQETQDLLLKESYKTNDKEKQFRIKTIEDLYNKNNFFSLATLYTIVNQFSAHQKNSLISSDWTFDANNEDEKKSKRRNFVSRIFDEENPLFYTERHILEDNGKTYLVADLHGDPSPVLDILQTLMHSEDFDPETGLLSDHIYISFNGDFVDKGLNGSACLLLIYSLKLLNPNQIIITRGNHEDPEFLKINKVNFNQNDTNEQKNKDQKPLFDFGSELYYKYYHNKNRFMRFLFPPDRIKEALSRSYAVMPVMAFLLHKKEADKFCGYVASHAGLDPAYNPLRLLQDPKDKKILFDYYDTESRLNPNNKTCKNALIEESFEIIGDVRKYCFAQYENRKNDFENFDINSLRDDDRENFTEYQKIMMDDIEKLKNFCEKFGAETAEDYFSLYVSEQIDEKINPFSLKIFSITTTSEGKKIFKRDCNNFNPFACLNDLQNMISYFQSPIESIKHISACWHWKEPNKEMRSSFSGKYGHSDSFTMSYQVFKALMKDYQQNNNVSLMLATQGHIQSAGLDYNKEFGLNQKAIFRGNGYGDAWQKDTEQKTFDSRNQEGINSYEEFCSERTFNNYANPCIAASCGSIYGCEQNEKQFKQEKNFKLRKENLTNEQHLDIQNRYEKRYPGQTYNPIVYLFLGRHKTICAAQVLAWH